MARVTWADVKASLNCDQLRALRARIDKEFQDNGVAGTIEDISHKLRPQINNLGTQIMAPAAENALIATFLNVALPKSQRDDAKQKLDANLALMKQRQQLMDLSWYLQDLVAMKNYVDCYINEKCNGKPTFTSATYPAVKDDPWKFIKLLLGGH